MLEDMFQYITNDLKILMLAISHLSDGVELYGMSALLGQLLPV
jgi:hypothetical protein